MESLSADQLFRKAGLVLTGTVAWGDAVPETNPGVYAISVVDQSKIQYDERFELERHYWNPDQEIVYIGSTKRPLSKRLQEFYSHFYGDGSPHSGGQAILLSKCAKVIQWVAVKKPAEMECRLLETFVKMVGQMPYGNRKRPACMSKVSN